MQATPLRRRLFLLVAASLLPLALISAVALYVMYGQQREQAVRNGLDVARAISTAVESELGRTQSILEVLASSIWLDEPDLKRFHERARRVHERQKHWHSVILSDETGRPILNTAQPADATPPAVVESESLKEVLADGKPRVGYLARGPRGNWAVPVRVPVVRNDRVRYVLTAVVDPQAFLELLQSARVPGGWTVAVSDSRGLRVARTQSVQQSLGTPFSPTLVEMMKNSGPEGSGVTHNSEGQAVFTAYTRDARTGWYTAVGLPVTGVEAGARDSFVTFGSGIAVSIALGLLAALFIARGITRPMAQLRDQALKLEPTETPVSPTTHIREIQDVAHALLASERERARAEAQREDLLHSERAARASAESANRAKDEFLAMLGHELRNPLAAISNAYALLEHPSVDEKLRRDARAIIGRQIQHLSRLTDDLLDAGRAIMGKIVLERRPHDLADCVRKTLATLAASGRTARHAIEADLKPAWVDADAIRLDQVISNLLVNAVKYSPEGSTIKVSVRREGDEAVLRVTDEGIGIPPELGARVFDLFVQGDRALDRSSGGLGIGLTLVRRLADLHGGSASVWSEGEGQGSEFTVRLPVIETPREEATQPRAAVHTGPRDILVVEDNDDARETLRMLLEVVGHNVRADADGESGLATALRERPEIMLIDVGLPRMDGYEVARRIRAADGWTVRPLLVAITGYGQAEDRERALAAGFDTHLTKPVEPEELMAVIAACAPAAATSPSGPSATARR